MKHFVIKNETFCHKVYFSLPILFLTVLLTVQWDTFILFLRFSFQKSRVNTSKITKQLAPDKTSRHQNTQSNTRPEKCVICCEMKSRSICYVSQLIVSTIMSKINSNLGAAIVSVWSTANAVNYWVTKFRVY